MVHFAKLVSVVALLSSAAFAIPIPDSGEPAVSAVDGTPVTEVLSSTTVAMSKETAMASEKEKMKSNVESSMSKEKMMEKEKTTQKYEQTSTKMMEHETKKMEENTMTKETKTTKKESKTTSTWKSEPTYGSGSSNWNPSPYDECVQQCVNKYAPPPSKYTPPPSSSSESDHGSAGGKGNGATHTVIVAPTKGVLRYVPFAVNASVGDTILYKWGAGPHTVTMGSALEICNKSSAENSFTSGPQNAGFEFTVVVNDTKPMFVYCNVPTHCQKGMFGVVNPPMAKPGSPAALNSMMKTWVEQDTNLAGYASDTKMKTTGTSAETWGSMFDTTQFPPESHVALAENVLFTRQTLASNPGMLEANSAERKDGQPISIPADLTAQAANPQGANGAAVSSAPSGSPTSTPDASSAAANAPTSAPASNGAASIASSSFVVALVAIFASFMAL
jgi:hypothetical protein